MATLKISQEILNIIYPVGSIYLSVNDTDPSKCFGGTWVQIAKGRTLVGVDTNDADFNTVQKTGGSKYLQKHNHTGSTGKGWTSFIRQVGLAGTSSAPNHAPGYQSAGYEDRVNTSNFCGSNHIHNFTTEDTGSGDSGNLQPYFTCYIWCRTS